MTESVLLNSFVTTAGKEWKKWQSQGEGVFYTVSTPEDSAERGGRRSPNAYNGAQAHFKGGNVKIPNPEGGGYLQVSDADASLAGEAANYESENVDYTASSTIELKSVNKSFTAEEIRKAYDNAPTVQGEIIQYL